MREDAVVRFILLGCLLTSCASTTREREAHCLAATMVDVWQTEHELTFAEQAWRTAQQAHAEPSADGQESLMLSVRLVNGDPAFYAADPTASSSFYQKVLAARAHHGEATKWYGLVARRVQTRIEEDEMLYPVLGMLATSTAIVLYPLVRWNVRSVLWDETDPDADDDPIQRFCATRLGEPSLRLSP